MVAQLSLIKNYQTDHIDRETNVEDIPKEFNNKEGISRTLDKESTKCDQSDFKSNKEVTLNKHMNTKHAEKVIENDTELNV